MTFLPPPHELKSGPFSNQSQDQSLFRAEHFRPKSCLDIVTNVAVDVLVVVDLVVVLIPIKQNYSKLYVKTVMIYYKFFHAMSMFQN